jgi:hypothetical protein
MEATLQPLTRKQRQELQGYIAWGITIFRAILYVVAVGIVGWLMRLVHEQLTDESSLYSQDAWWIVPLSAAIPRPLQREELPMEGIRHRGSARFKDLLREEAKSLGVFRANYREVEVDFEALKRSLLLFLGLVLTGCSETARISAVARLDPPLTTDMLTVTVREESGGWTWRGSDFRSSIEWPTPTTRDRETGSRGQIGVSFRLDASGSTVSEGSVTLPLRRDWRWGLQIISATSDPREACFDCTGSKAFSLAPEYRGPERDSVWVMWGGDSIAEDATH